VSYYIYNNNGRQSVDAKVFVNIVTVMARPPKKPEDRKTAKMLIPMTDEEKQLVQSAAEADAAKPVTWARDALLRAAKRRAKGA
jgi:hypothetical protein